MGTESRAKFKMKIFLVTFLALFYLASAHPRSHHGEGGHHERNNFLASVSLPRHQANKMFRGPRERRAWLDSEGTLWEECVHETCNSEEVYESVGGPRDWAMQYAAKIKDLLNGISQIEQTDEK